MIGGIHQPELPEPHGFNGSGTGTDIARDSGFYQDETNLGQNG